MGCSSDYSECFVFHHDPIDLYERDYLFADHLRRNHYEHLLMIMTF